MVPPAPPDLRAGFRLGGTQGMGVQGLIDILLEGVRADVSLDVADSVDENAS